MPTIAIALGKGGCGKSTTAITLASCLAERGRPVRVIDADPQGTSVAVLSPHADALLDVRSVAGARWIPQAIRADAWNVIDLPPGMTDSGLAVLQVADAFLVPLPPSIRGLVMLAELIERAGRLPNPPGLLGILLTMTDRSAASRQTGEAARAGYGKLVFKSEIPRSARAEAATAAGLPLTAYAPMAPITEAYRALTMEVIRRVES